MFLAVSLVVSAAILAGTSHAVICNLKNNAVRCTGRRMTNVPSNITAHVHPETILQLDLSDNAITNLQRGAFENYTKIEEIILANNDLKNIEPGAFDNTSSLMTLNVSHNKLRDFHSEYLKSNMDLQFLDLSNNELESWESFKAKDLISLKYMDISNNRFTYLPLDILERLELDPNFVLVVDNNPWNCSNENFVNFKAAKYLCEIGEEFVATTPVDAREEAVPTEESRAGDVVPLLNATETPVTNYCVVKVYRRNLLAIWIVLALFAGIILGNGDRIYGWISSKCQKKPEPRRTVDEETALR